MKKLLLILSTAFVLSLVGCSYDDSRLWDVIDKLEEEQEKLEEEQEQMQEQLNAQQTLLNALANKLTITAITDTAEGYTIVFSDGSTAIIKDGEKGDKGDKGDTGAQGEKGDKGDKGDTGEKGDQGEKGEDGTDGKDGQDGKDGDSFFQSVTWDDMYVYFTLADGSVITILLAPQLTNEIWYTSTDGEIVEPYTVVDNKGKSVFGANIISNTCTDGKGIITFDGDVTSIGYSAFDGCTSLKSITIPDSVTSIGDFAFRYCTSLTSITIPDSITSIGWAAFCYCTSLTSITIPDSVTSIGEGAFSGCTSLTNFQGKFASNDGRCLIVDGVLNSFAPAGLTTYTIPDSVTTIGAYAFEYCTSLTSITIPDSVTSIGEWAFAYCSSLTSVTIGNGVTSIGSSAFSDCTSLTSITIPDSVTSIGEYAFAWCTSLISVYCKPTTPPTRGYDMFYKNASDRKIYVPTASVNAYKAAEYWSKYASAIEGYDF